MPMFSRFPTQGNSICVNYQKFGKLEDPVTAQMMATLSIMSLTFS